MYICKITTHLTVKNMKKFTYILIACLISSSAFTQNPTAYRIYNQKGEQVFFSSMVENLSNAEFILFGELHDNPISHWLQLELTLAIHEKVGEKLVLGAEMFETDNQLILSEYLNGIIGQKRFEEEARLWNNYKTDYKPLVEFAKEKKLPFIATNIPRRYASIVATGGFEVLATLSDEAKRYIAKQPVEYDPELPGYKAMLSMGGMPGKAGATNDNFPKAQAIKDATMAQFIVENWKPGRIFIHYHGTYHSNNFDGIYWYIKRKLPNARIGTIATVLQDDVEKLADENLNLANFIIVVPNRMTRTY
jgi:uncharacterized iron-regulated protein